METYVHRQVWPWPLLALGFFAFLRGKARRRAWPLLGFGLLTVQFCVLNTHVDERGVSWSFGLGFPSGYLALDQIAAVQLTTTTPSETLGIHWTPWHGLVWKVAGRDAVMIRKTSGGTVTLGSDDAAGLCNAINTRLRSA